jgi:alpha-methylacyl-CoA racemase
MAEAPTHPHHEARGTFAEIDGVMQPMPAPRYSATPTEMPRPAAKPGADTDALLASLGYDGARISSMREAGAVA